MVAELAARPGFLRYAGFLLVAALFVNLILACAPAQAPAHVGNPPGLARVGPTAAAPSGTPTAVMPAYAAGQLVRFEHVGVPQGLSQTDVLCIVQDRLGFMWFGTQDGLNRYDGHEFKVWKHDPDDPKSLAGNYINSLLVDSVGTLWVGTNGAGLDRYDRENGVFVHYRTQPGNPKGLPGNSITALFEDHEGVLWVATGGGVARINPDRTSISNLKADPTAPQALRDTALPGIYEDQRQDLWFATATGLYRYDRVNARYVGYRNDPADPASIGSDQVNAIAEDASGALWVGTNGGLDRLGSDRSAFRHYRAGAGKAAGLSNNPVQRLHVDRAGAVWIGTRMGVDRLDPATEKLVHLAANPADPSALNDNLIHSIYEDAAGVLWIGTWSGGLNRLDPRTLQFVHYRREAGNPASLLSSVILAIYEPRPGLAWVGTDQGLDLLDRTTGQATHYSHDDANPGALSDWSVRAIYQDRSGVLWVGTQAGLNRLDPDARSFTHYVQDPNGPASLAHNTVESIYEDPAGNLWIGTVGGLDKLDRPSGRFEHFGPAPTTSDGGGNSRIKAIYPSRDGGLWLATQSGLNHFNPATGAMVRYANVSGDPTSLGVNPLLGVYEDPSGIVWVGTITGGLDRLDPATGKFKHYRAKQGLPDDTVYAILPDNAGNLWLSTNKGLARFDPRNQSFKNYSAGDGLQSDEFNQGAYYRSSTGELFFGGINGLTIFDPAALRDDAYVPPVALTSFTQGGRDVHVGTALENLRQVTLHWPANYFEFEFAGLSYAQPQKNRYAYRLEGFDRDWNEIGFRRFASYTNLPGGSYTLRLRASNAAGLWNEEGASIAVTVVPPFWENWLLRGLLVCVLAGLVAGGYRWRVRDIETRNRALESQVAERTVELAQRTADVEAHYEAAQRRAERFRLIAEGGRRVASVLDVQEVLVEVANLVHETLGYYHVGIGLIEGDEVVYRVAAGTLADDPHFGYSPPRLKAGQEGLTGWVAANGQPLLVPDVSKDTRYVWMGASRTCSELLVPVISKGQTIGVLDAQSDRVNAFEEGDVALLQLLANQAGTAIENARLYERAQELAAMRERTRLARDLHDAVTQTLFSASLLAEVLPSTWEADPAQGRRMLQDLRQLTRGALAEMRTLLLELRPSALVEARLEDLLRQLAEAVSGRTGLPVAVSVEGPAELPPDVHVAFYRIAQEALNNVVKHARARRVSVDLCSHPHVVTLAIIDDGRGFDPAKIPPERLGLGIMHERAQAAGATLNISSAPGRGTQVSLSWENTRREQ